MFKATISYFWIRTLRNDLWNKSTKLFLDRRNIEWKMMTRASLLKWWIDGCLESVRKWKRTWVKCRTITCGSNPIDSFNFLCKRPASILTVWKMCPSAKGRGEPAVSASWSASLNHLRRPWLITGFFWMQARLFGALIKANDIYITRARRMMKPSRALTCFQS